MKIPIFNHPFHLVDMSPWPLTSACGAFLLTSGFTDWFLTGSFFLAGTGLSSIILSMIQWWRDISREATYQGIHTVPVATGMQWGMILFIVSEIMFFFSFFWAFFHSSLSPCLELGAIWPPMGVYALDPFGVPLLNTVILLSSGVTVTWAHHSLLEQNFKEAKESLFITIILGAYFTRVQVMEYFDSSFSLADSVYGSIFFVATGFHGFHVFIGASFLAVVFYRLWKSHFSSEHHFGFEAAAWYWHFVDVVWLFLFIFIYWWGAA
uniref:Cytochrome c oxidase subunit 3 n=1 Tax=Janira maculosa TaxID=155701 RepID=E3SXB1_9CRUS|nr:cytochrome c oxidase subunit III [Janira maculosa]